MRTAKLRVRAESLPWLLEIDRCIRTFDMRGVDALRHAASDALDGLVYSSELADLRRRGLATIVRDGPHASLDELAGHAGSWSAQLTEKAMCALWPDMLGTDDAHGVGGNDGR